MKPKTNFKQTRTLRSASTCLDQFRHVDADKRSIGKTKKRNEKCTFWHNELVVKHSLEVVYWLNLKYLSTTKWDRAKITSRIQVIYISFS